MCWMIDIARIFVGKQSVGTLTFGELILSFEFAATFV